MYCSCVSLCCGWKKGLIYKFRSKVEWTKAPWCADGVDASVSREDAPCVDLLVVSEKAPKRKAKTAWHRTEKENLVTRDGWRRESREIENCKCNMNDEILSWVDWFVTWFHQKRTHSTVRDRLWFFLRRRMDNLPTEVRPLLTAVPPGSPGSVLFKHPK